MIVSFFARGTGGGSGSVDYLLGKDRDRELAKVLRGNPEETVALIDSSNYTKKYTSGVLSFEEADIAEEQKRELMASFEECLFPGLDKNQYNVLWVEHTDKGRLELNFVIPNLELTTGKRLQPYYHAADLQRVDAWRTIQNLEHNFSDPDDPEKRQTLVLAKDLPRGKKEAAELINSGIMALAAEGAVTNRDGVIAALERGGFEIARQTKQSISIKDPDGGRNIRLKGALYEQDFRLSQDIQRDIEQRSREHKASASKRLAEARERYSYGIKVKQQELEKRHPRQQQGLAAGDTSQSEAYELDPIQDLGGGVADSELSSDWADWLEREAERNGSGVEPSYSREGALFGAVAEGNSDAEEGSGDLFYTGYGDEAARSVSEHQQPMDYQGGRLNDGNGEVVAEYIKELGQRVRQYREQSERDRGEYSDELAKHRARARTGTAKDFESFARAIKASDSIGRIERASGAVKRAKRGAERAITAAYQFVRKLKDKVRDKARGFGFSR